MALVDQPRLLGMAAAASWRRLRRLLAGGRGQVRISGPAPERLLLAPQDLHTADPTVAQEIYAGVFHLAGREVSTQGLGPFRTPPPTPQWERELHAFGWLRHLEAAGEAISATNAQALVGDWIDANPRPRDDAAWDAETTARRLISWLSHSVMIVDGADMRTYRRFMKAIGNHIRYLRGVTDNAPPGVPQLTCLIALAYGDVCVVGPRFGVRQAQRNLDHELTRQILPDGGHISRNPGVLPGLLAMLLPLRQSYARIGQAPSTELISAIDRMLPALRFFRHLDGDIARFNGMGTTEHDLVATVVRYEESLGGPPSELPMSGYNRLGADGACVIVDTGKPPAGVLSRLAHAGTLAFEMSADDAPLVVNCGAPPPPGGEAVKAARSTAAHSTATVNDTSSSRFAAEGVVGRLLESRIVQGPSAVNAERGEREHGVFVGATHDGYARGFSIVHGRRLELSRDGSTLFGEDRFAGADREGTEREIAVRFHLHPSVRAEMQPDGHTVLLARVGRPTWRFACTDIAPAVEESVFFAVPDGARRTRQIVLRFACPQRRDVSWLLQRLEQAG